MCVKFSEPTQAQITQHMIQKRETANPLKVTVNSANTSPIKTVDIGSDTLRYAITKQPLIIRLTHSKKIKIFSPISRLKTNENEHNVLQNQLP